MAGIAVSPGYSLTPSNEPMTLQSNYLGSADFDFLRVELPDLYEQEFARYGEQSISSFLRMFAAEFPSTSDLIKWTEEGRLHTIYDDATAVAATGVVTKVAHVFRKNQTVLIGQAAGIIKGIITAVTADTFTVGSYSAATLAPIVDGAVTVYVFGSEFKKGTNGMEGSITPVPEFFDNKPIIIKDKYEINGSDLAQIGWVEVDTPEGSGYLWYLKANSDTRKRFEDYLEMSMIEGEKAAAGSGAATFLGAEGGTDGLFDVVASRGNVVGGVADALVDWDTIIKRLDKQGAVAENAVYVNRVQDLAIDDMLAAQNSYGADGTSYGMFNNDKSMALTLRFQGFHRAGYDFYKSSWKYLNDAATRGGLESLPGTVNGILIPSGTKTVYDQILGKKVALPFLHIKYRSAPSEDRKFKTWLTGSAGGANNSDLDAMQVQYLSERALITLGANNFVLFQDAT